MNMFNCFQAVAFYTLLPFGIQWLYMAGHTGFMYVGCVAQLIGYVLMSIAINDSKSLA